MCMCVWHLAAAVLNDKAVKPEEEVALITAEYSIWEFLWHVHNIINNRLLEVYQKGTCLKNTLDNMQQRNVNIPLQKLKLLGSLYGSLDVYARFRNPLSGRHLFCSQFHAFGAQKRRDV